ncbi:DUF1269 domain-containing protein [Serinibacter salmoneus]|uniref:Putative membrane protein n=1 Tax=Serinibacter salmoneus TaxID=556530 RepID=A0A2A9D1S9_9MICO|nr:DUF1269 domain-containing protein [Serinibacter salmoneus]PFG20647.1 putative membrane protein [Serinibacter salmoneus]
MATFTAWKYETAEGAAEARAILKRAAGEGLIKVEDQAVLSWPEGAPRPDVNHGHEDGWRDTGWGALIGGLVGTLFFVPFLGIAAGAAIGAVSSLADDYGVTKDEIEVLKNELAPGTSILLAVTSNGDLDRVGERFHGLKATLVATNLSGAEKRDVEQAIEN